jgi:hypothetical protein
MMSINNHLGHIVVKMSLRELREIGLSIKRTPPRRGGLFRVTHAIAGLCFAIRISFFEFVAPLANLEMHPACRRPSGASRLAN